MKKLTILIMIVFLTSCADSPSLIQAASMEQVGFWSGVWHGMILPFAWFISLFSDDTAIYAIYNNGGWYDFGFFLGVGSLAGGSSTAKRR